MIECTEKNFLILLETVKLYADPDTYFATWIVGDRPAGAINDDYSTHDHPEYEEDDVRPGYGARKALELVGFEGNDPDPNFDYLKSLNIHVSYYDNEYREEMAKRGLEES